MPYQAPVLDSAGETIGTAESLLGDEDDDIFHGIVVRRQQDGRDVEIEAAQVTKITTDAVHTSVSPEQVPQLPPYEESKRYRIEWGGLFRKRPEWRESDR